LHFHDLRGTAATRFYIAGLGIVPVDVELEGAALLALSL
jgi:hypothetical protein